MASSFRSGVRPGYEHPAGEWTAVAAPLWRRGAASALDWALAAVLYVLLLIPAGILDAVAGLLEGDAGRALRAVAYAGAVAGIVAYFALLIRSGHTLGMRALDVHVFAHGSGREPGAGRALARALLAVLLGAAVLNAYSYLLGWAPVDALSAEERAAGEVAVVLAAVGLAGQLWALVDREGRTLWDRLTGLVVVEDVVPANLPERLWSRWRP